jgi:hypothetical protein
VPYSKLDNPQTLNLYGYMRNNPLAGVDADGHDGLWDQAKQYLNAVEVKVSTSLGVHGEAQWGAAKGEYHATFGTAELKSGLAGGGKEASVSSGVGASISAGPVKGSAGAEAKVSTADGMSAGANAKFAVGPAGTEAKATVDKEGPHASIGPSAGADKDFKVGGSGGSLIGVGVSVNFSQLGRALQSTADSFNKLGSYVMDKITPSQSGPPSGLRSGSPF